MEDLDLDVAHFFPASAHTKSLKRIVVRIITPFDPPHKNLLKLLPLTLLHFEVVAQGILGGIGSSILYGNVWEDLPNLQTIKLNRGYIQSSEGYVSVYPFSIGSGGRVTKVGRDNPCLEVTLPVNYSFNDRPILALEISLMKDAESCGSKFFDTLSTLRKLNTVAPLLEKITVDLDPRRSKYLFNVIGETIPTLKELRIEMHAFLEDDDDDEEGGRHYEIGFPVSFVKMSHLKRVSFWHYYLCGLIYLDIIPNHIPKGCIITSDCGQCIHIEDYHVADDYWTML